MMQMIHCFKEHFSCQKFLLDVLKLICCDRRDYVTIHAPEKGKKIKKFYQKQTELSMRKYRVSHKKVYAFGTLWNKEYVTDIQNYVNLSKLNLDEKLLSGKITHL